MMPIFLGLLLLSRIPPVTEGTPNRQPQLAASGGVTALVYSSGRSILFARSTDDGATFSKAVTIAELPVVAVGRHRGPRVTFAGGTIVVSAIGGKTLATGTHAHGLPADGDLQLWRSTDGGKTWSGAVTVNDTPGAAREGLHAITSDEKGHMAAVWLDLRGKGTRLYGSYSADAGATWSKNVLVYESPEGTICQCCHPSMAALGGDEFAVMFRNAIEGCRDMYLTRMRRGDVVATAAKAGKGTWKINACPMDGGGMVAVGGKVVTAWRREEDLYLAMPGEEEKKIGTGKDIALVAQGEKIYAAWTAGGKIEAWVGGKREVIGDTGGFPALVSLPHGGVLAAWEDQGAIALKRLE